MRTMKYLLPWQVARVVGPSMTPGLLPGDVVLASYRAPVVAGAVVLARFRSHPELLVIKRAVREQEGGWLLASDNARAGSDSRQHGVAEALARVRWTWPLAAAHRRTRWSSWSRLLGHRVAVRPPWDL
jgi:phage repressor protein C with HTH and peptisase S24 domain